MSRTSRLRRTTLNTATLQEVALHRVGWSATGAVANPYLPLDTPKAIKDAMVLYYDIAKQKATNESMALSPILKDLSGNGNDATCYNFGWSGMSGIGGYNYKVNDNKTYKYNSKFTIIDSTTIHFNKVTINSTNKYILCFFPFRTDNMTGTYTLPSLKVKIDNPNNANLQFGLSTPIDERVSFNDSRVIEVPEKTVEVNNRQIAIGLFYLDDATDGVDVDITLTILPEYPNALVSDGVDDYAYVQDKYDDEGNLINKKSLVLNREDGYTVIAKRKWINPPINGEIITSGCTFVSKRKTSDTGALVTEFYNTPSKMWMCRSFSGNIAIDDGISPEDIIYQKSTSYNGQHSLSIGDWDDSDTLYIGSLMNSEYCGNVALYSLILFNRDLTDEEIEWVKSNLIQ